MIAEKTEKLSYYLIESMLAVKGDYLHKCLFFREKFSLTFSAQANLLKSLKADFHGTAS